MDTIGTVPGPGARGAAGRTGMVFASGAVVAPVSTLGGTPGATGTIGRGAPAAAGGAPGVVGVGGRGAPGAVGAAGRAIGRVAAGGVGTDGTGGRATDGGTGNDGAGGLIDEGAGGNFTGEVAALGAGGGRGAEGN